MALHVIMSIVRCDVTMNGTCYVWYVYYCPDNCYDLPWTRYTRLDDIFDRQHAVTVNIFIGMMHYKRNQPSSIITYFPERMCSVGRGLNGGEITCEG